MRTPLQPPAGIFADGTSHSESGHWGDGSNVRFTDLGAAEPIHGWESVISTLLTGVCRTIFPWTDNANILNLAFGTHSKLQVWQSGALADITPAALAAGQVDGTGSTGYGTGAWGIGGWNQPSADEYFPRTWSFGAWGQNLIANPRGGKIYAWANNLAVIAAAVTNAPVNVTHALVAPMDGGYQLFALGCNEETSGTFNPLCIRHSSVRNNTVWNTAANTTAREYILTGGGRIVAGRMVGPRLLVWTLDALFIGTFTANLAQPWRFERIEKGAGLIGPNAAVVIGQTAYWLSPDLRFCAYQLGGSPETITCTVHKDFSDHLAASQADKIVASSNGKFSEVRFDYPDSREGVENSRYLAVKIGGPQSGSWYRGIMGRTAMVDSGPSAYPCGVTVGGSIYWHEKGNTADGGVLSWFIETADQMLNDEYALDINGMWPDFKDQQGAVSITLTSRFTPNGVETVFGPYVVAPSDDKTDMRASGRYYRIKFSGDSAPSFARLGRQVFDAARAGRR